MVAGIGRPAKMDLSLRPVLPQCSLSWSRTASHQSNSHNKTGGAAISCPTDTVRHASDTGDRRCLTAYDAMPISGSSLLLVGRSGGGPSTTRAVSRSLLGRDADRVGA